MPWEAIMPIHDWSRVPSGLFHHFHQTWSVQISLALNGGMLPRGLSALVEQRAGPYEGDVLTIETRGVSKDDGGVATMPAPQATIIRRTTKEIYADRGNQVVIRHHLGRIVAVIEILSPGNKDSRASLRDFVEKTLALMRKGVHLLIVDLFPPTPRDPFGMHKVIWDEITEEDFTFPPGKDRILASYQMGRVREAYVEPIAVGDALPPIPLFLLGGRYIHVPLESTYQATWAGCSEVMRTAVETGVMPEEVDD